MIYFGNPCIRHTVHTSEITAVCYGNPYIFYISSMLINHNFPLSVSQYFYLSLFLVYSIFPNFALLFQTFINIFTKFIKINAKKNA